MTSSSSSGVQTATAWQYDRRGRITETLQKKEVKIRPLKPGEALIKVHAAALNPVDWKIAQLAPWPVQKIPRIAAADFAGEIVSISKEKETPEMKEGWLKQGARVYGFLPAEDCIKTGEGSLTTYLIVSHSLLGPIPDQMKYEDASGLTTVGLTAAMMVSRVKKGDRVLVLGGTTSVGLSALQMCKAEQASFMAATCSPDKASKAKECGATETINYRDGNVEEQLKDKYGSSKFNVILDTVGSFEIYQACPAYLQEDGTYVNIGFSDLDSSRLLLSGAGIVYKAVQALVLPSWLGGTPRRYVLGGVKNHYMPRIRQWVSSGALKPTVDSVFQFDETIKAYEHLMKGRALGKVVVNVVQ